MFRVGDRVKVNYNGADAEKLRERGIDTTFEGTVYDSSEVMPMYRVTADSGVTPFGDEDPTWYVWEQELEALAA